MGRQYRQELCESVSLKFIDELNLYSEWGSKNDPYSNLFNAPTAPLTFRAPSLQVRKRVASRNKDGQASEWSKLKTPTGMQYRDNEYRLPVHWQAFDGTKFTAQGRIAIERSNIRGSFVYESKRWADNQTSTSFDIRLIKESSQAIRRSEQILPVSYYD